MKFTRIAVVAVAGAVTSLAFAGFESSVPVSVTFNPDGSGAATGNMLTARYSDNDIEYIGCGIRVFEVEDGSTFSFGFCQAGDADANEAFCSTQNVELLSAMHATADYSFVTFAFDAEGACNRIGFSTQSVYVPHKVHRSKNDDDSDSDSDSDSD